MKRPKPRSGTFEVMLERVAEPVSSLSLEYQKGIPLCGEGVSETSENDVTAGYTPFRETPTGLQSLCRDYAHHATELSARIEQFQNWLNNLAGQTAATCWQRCGERSFLGLQYVRDNGWELQFTRVNVPDGLSAAEEAQYRECQADWVSLLRCTVETKAAMIELFPDLMRAIAVSAAKRLKEVISATQKFDEFAKQFGVAEEGGK